MSIDTVGYAQGHRLLKDPGYGALSHAIELEEPFEARWAKQLIVTICGFVVAGLIWAALTRVNIVVRSYGVVEPSGDIVAVQHIHGGIVDEILVDEGEAVKIGDPLLKLAPLETQAELNQLLSRRAAILLSIERERAVAESRVPEFERIVSDFAEQKQEQLSLYRAQSESVQSQKDVLISQIGQKKTELLRLTNQIEAAKRDKEAAADEFRIRKDLYDKGLTTRDRFYGAQRDLRQIETLLADLGDQATRTIKEVTEAEQRLDELDKQVRTDARRSINDSVARLAEVEEGLNNLRGRADRLLIAAPVNGIVKGLTVNAINSVIRPGVTVLEIVPIDETMIVEAHVLPKNIGQIALDQPVDVRVSAFDTTIYGMLGGRVERISPATFQDSGGASYYKIRVTLDQAYFGADPVRNHVLPGMTVEADIRTGKRSLLNYLLKPVTRAWDDAFHER